MAGMDSIWRIRRSVTDRKLAGVCGGVAAYWGVDPVLVRVGWALLALTGGVGVVLYVAGWLLIPLGTAARSGVDDLFGGAAANWPKEVWVTLVVIACVAAFALFGSVSPFGIGPALMLAVVWYFGFYRNRAGAPGSGWSPPSGLPPAAPAPAFRYPGPATPFTEAASAWQRRVQEVHQDRAPSHPADPTPPATSVSAPPAPQSSSATDRYAAFLAEPDPAGLYTEPAPAPLPVRRRASPAARRLRLVTLTVLGSTLGGLGLADYLGASIPLSVYAAAALAVVGLALVIATWLGRARGLLGLGVLLGLVALVGSTGLGADVTDPAQYGSRQLSYTGGAALPAEPDHVGTGELTVDLSGLRATRDLSYRASVDNGQLVVVIPPGTGVQLHYALKWGQVETFGQQLVAGANLEQTETLVPAAPGGPTLNLDLRVRRGRLEVRR